MVSSGSTLMSNTLTLSNSDVVTNDENDKYADRRCERRVDVMFHGFVSDLDGDNVHNCLICNISKSGCQFRSAELDSLPDDVLVMHDKFDKPMKGRIRWRTDGRAGVEFLVEDSEPGEKREARRFDVSLSGVVSGLYEENSHTCNVLNISGKGCLIASPEVCKLPNMVRLKIEPTNEIVTGRVVWRNLDMVGVYFTDNVE